MELQTMPLRFRVWDKMQKKFLLEGADLDEYASLWAGAGVGGEDEVISQDTGLKDKNGKSIYTGDIISDENGVGIIEYESPILQVRYSYKFTSRVINGEIVGDIWQNSDLLEYNGE